ncbi:MAG: class I SAM-dependent methyltransferase [Rhizobiaceae bacterium]|nr:class I SAM-dependent methyltransferase [Rhizobiaceae bacterium]MCV0405498.1 class I SAM-dependent methyltransferase [Rhizobiaceae bacterium]
MSVEAQDGAQTFLKAFSDPKAVAAYAEGPPRFVPGFEALHRMTGILLAEAAPTDAHILVLGAGGGLELKALAESHPGWRFTGVDPARAMLDLAKTMTRAHADRIELVEGYIDAAPEGPFDGATCLLTLHFLDRAERTRTAAEIRRRLRPGAPFVAAHGSYDRDEGETWLSRYAAYATASGVEADKAEAARAAVAASVNMMDPREDEAVLRDAGFRDVTQFWAAFTWRGWVARA